MKKGFTLAETLITLTIIGIIMAVVMPLVSKVQPDRDVLMFKKGMYSLQAAVGNATDLLVSQGANTSELWSMSSLPVDPNSEDEDDDENPANSREIHFCARIADHLNTAVENCGGSGSYDSPQIVTTDGMRIWNLPQNNFNGSVTICMDRPLTGKEIQTLTVMRNNWTPCGGNRGLSVKIRHDGKVFLPLEANYEKDLIDKSFNVTRE